jgi:hypothetical protein
MAGGLTASGLPSSAALKQLNPATPASHGHEQRVLRMVYARVYMVLLL